ncbi:metallophosphoesterase [Ferruginibacter sp. SUN106]|uniref:metallophosphoesterase n=1 Tax=Ferruginibacter sp. SUN106 TaxID=2978348 RepID=UPI003D3683B2
MRTPLGVIIFISIMLLLDTYVFQAVKSVSQALSPKAKTIIYSVYWLLTALAIISFLLFVYTEQDFLGKKVRTYLFATVIGLFLAKITAGVFFLIDDIRRGIQWGAIKLFSNSRSGTVDDFDGEGISRSAFLNWLGLAAGGTLFGTLLYGFGNKYKYDIKRLQLTYENLPASFKGLKIVHISDIHSGSFTDKKAVLHGVEKILNEKPDIILFTGDLVNDRATEMQDYMDVFSLLKAPMGVYSTLGNHDYGDYVQWPQNGVTKEQNLENLKKVHADLGWRLLMNEHVALERNGEAIALLGIENWSNKARFPKHGRMDLAHPGTEKYPFKILMSHDPSHWDAQVKTNYPDIDLMLSGHTHGMQFGIDIPGFKWSPVQYMYTQWAGLYEDGKQKINVNRGYGFIGYPGRVGVLPEISVITLG